MQILFNVFRTGACPTFVFFKKSVVKPRVRVSQVYRSRECLPHLAPEPIRKTNLNEARALWVTEKGQIAAMSCANNQEMESSEMMKRKGWSHPLDMTSRA